MIPVRKSIGGLGNLLFKQAYLYGQVLDHKIPDEYVQSMKYWDKHAPFIRHTFSPGIDKSINMVSLQIRRGDYVNNPFYVDVTQTDYYQKAIAMFPEEKFLVFCHDNQDPWQDKMDKDWCRDFLGKLIPGRFEINQPKGETEDLNKMASCRHNIIANSTFGWWAGFLNPNPNKKVVCPARWFSDGIQRTELPEEFIKI